MLSAIVALFLGGVISFIGVILHNSFHPIGIILALLTTLVGINFIGKLFGSRKYKIFAAIGWILITLRAGTFGLSHEILIISNLYGNLFLLGGLLITVFAVLKRN